MAELAIPDEHKAALDSIRTMPEVAISNLISQLEKSPRKVPSVQGLAPNDAENIKDIVAELYKVRSYFDMSIADFASGIAAALQEEVRTFPADEIPRFKSRLEKLLSLNSVTVSVKAQSLKGEYPNRFCTARILTDGRPVYGDDTSAPPLAAIITHNLRISYHDDSPHVREFYISMDGDDVRTLRNLLDRAETKAKSLESIFIAANVSIVEQ